MLWSLIGFFFLTRWSYWVFLTTHMFMKRKKWALTFQEILSYWKKCPICEIRNTGTTVWKSFLGGMHDYSLSTDFFWDCLSRCQHSIFPLFLVSIALERSRDKVIWITISSNGVNTCVSVSDCMLWHHTFSTLSTLLFNKCLFSSWAINLP